MRKSDKKLDNQLRQVLTEVCEHALKDIAGFQWLTHTANYDVFPQSLRIICVFDTEENLSIYKTSNDSKYLHILIADKLSTLGIKFKKNALPVSLDTEERCEAQHQGNWAKRLSNETNRHIR